MKGKLFVVATPIGNLQDITLRAIDVLSESDLILSEDTRVTSKLMAALNISKTLISFNEHSKSKKTNYIINKILSGQNVCLVTDAGTPGISDPGGFLVDEAYKNDIEIIGLPGASAVTLALSVSGFFAGEFIFLGYFPKKKGRQTLIKGLVKEKRTVVFYESPYRIKKTLSDISLELPEREIFVGRELTKKFEEIYRGKVSDIKDKIKEKGEFVVVLRGVK
jgi:16S rRNA (cytidine1402-2'-O)-methyltransferase